MRKLVATTAFTAVLALAASPVPAQTPYYQNKQLRVLVGFTPGGGTDLFGRIVAEGLARSIEGKPNVVVQNMGFQSENALTGPPDHERQDRQWQ